MQKFQSTPPARGATATAAKAKRTVGFQSTPPARGATFLWLLCLPASAFQSTPPARGATRGGTSSLRKKIISIHAPREGGDDDIRPGIRKGINFNPRPPRGGRRLQLWKMQEQPLFQSTPPARGATTIPPNLRPKIRISIHAPREGGDGSTPVPATNF